MIELAAIFVVWAYILVFLALTRRAARDAGKPVWLFAKGRERQSLPAALFRLSFVLGAILPVITHIPRVSETQAWMLTPFVLGVAARLAGIVLVTAGANLALYSQAYMGKSWRIGAAGQGILI